MKLYTAHDKQQFKELLGEIQSDLVLDLKSQSKASDALFIYLMRLRTGRPFEEIALHFGVSAATVYRRCELVRTVLKKIIVPRFVNFEMDRAELIAHKSETSRILFDDENQQRAHLILDGTYIYIEKSTNHRFQKDSYNSHKMRNYLKIMMGVMTDGRILFVLGPFKAVDNDATIIEKIFGHQSTASIKSLMPEDVMIVDRGFRNCEATLINLGFVVKMPTCHEYGRLSTKDANETRLVTRVRYNVERVNGVMKSVWKMFLNTIDVHYIPKIMDDFEIGAALINRKSNLVQNTAKSVEIANCMKLRQNQPNLLSTIVEKESFERLIRAKSYEVLNNFDDCPRMNIENLEMISLGTYQIQQARCYLSNRNNVDHPVFRFFDDDVHRFLDALITPDIEPLLLMMNLKSRFVSTKIHRTFVLINKIEVGHNCVVAYTCSCKSGNRTIGCCSHVMSVLYLISYGNIQEVSKHLNNVFEWDVEEEGSDDSSDENE